MYKGQTITTLAENGRKGFRALCTMVLEVGDVQQWSKRQPGRKKEARNKMAEKGPK